MDNGENTEDTPTAAPTPDAEPTITPEVTPTTAPGENNDENYWCVNKNASEEDIQATLDFMKWVVESDEGRDMLANEMGFVTPFTTFSDYLPDNPLVKANAEYTARMP